MQIKQVSIANYATGAYVAILYLIFICLLFGGFASYISRVNLGKDLASDVGSLDTVIFRATREAELRQRVDIVKEQHFQMQNELRRLQAKVSLIDESITFQTARLIEQFALISISIGANEDVLDAEFVAEYRDTLAKRELHPTTHAEQLSVALSAIRFVDNATLEEREAIANRVAEVLSSLSKLREEISTLRASFHQTKQQEELLSVDLHEHKIIIENLNTELFNISEILEDEHRALIASFKNSLGGIPYYLIQIPTIILTLIVTIAAGGLGSVVAFTRKFLRGFTGTGSGRLFVNVGEGVAAAVAIFLFAGAGMLMLTQGAAGAEGKVELSPYMVAFIAFVSGFMAEDAFLRIQIAGGNLFQVEGQGDQKTKSHPNDEDSNPGDDAAGNAVRKGPASSIVTD